MKKVASILLSLLVILNVFLCFNVLRKDRQMYALSLDNESKEELSLIISFILENSNRSINPYQELNIEGDASVVRFSDLTTQPKLFFYYNDMSCAPCSDRELNKLDSLSNIIGIDNVFLLTKNTSFKDIYLLRRINSFSFKVAVMDEPINLPISKYPTNYYFILDSHCFIRLFFVPIKNSPDLNELFYSQVVNYFEDESQGT